MAASIRVNKPKSGILEALKKVCKHLSPQQIVFLMFLVLFSFQQSMKLKKRICIVKTNFLLISQRPNSHRAVVLPHAKPWEQGLSESAAECVQVSERPGRDTVEG